MLDLSFLQPKKMEPWYDLRLSDHKDLDARLREAHFYSMLHSQRHDYNADIRLVLSEKDITKPDLDPFTLDAYEGAPGIATAIKVSKEVVIRHPSRPDELLVSTGSGSVQGYGGQGFIHKTVNQRRARPATNTGEVASHVSRPKGERDLGF